MCLNVLHRSCDLTCLPGTIKDDTDAIPLRSATAHTHEGWRSACRAECVCSTNTVNRATPFHDMLVLKSGNAATKSQKVSISECVILLHWRGQGLCEHQCP